MRKTSLIKFVVSDNTSRVSTITFDREWKDYQVVASDNGVKTGEVVGHIYDINLAYQIADKYVLTGILSVAP